MAINKGSGGINAFNDCKVSRFSRSTLGVIGNQRPKVGL